MSDNKPPLAQVYVEPVQTSIKPMIRNAVWFLAIVGALMLLARLFSSNEPDVYRITLTDNAGQLKQYYSIGKPEHRGGNLYKIVSYPNGDIYGVTGIIHDVAYMGKKGSITIDR